MVTLIFMQMDFPIKYPSNLNKDLISKSILLTSWNKILNKDITINSVDVITADIFPGNRIGIFEAEINYTSNSIQCEDRIIMLGGSASMIVLIKCEETGELFTVLVQQPRIASGGLQYEYPAGLTDDSTDYKLTSIRELEEECGITLTGDDEVINIGELINGSDVDYFTYSNLFYESVHFYMTKKIMKLSEIKELEGRYGGVDEEQITMHVCKFKDIIFLSKDPATVSITHLIDKLIKDGKISI